MAYRFRVGTKNLPGVLSLLGYSGFNHACLLLNKDLFEYGANSDKSYERHKDVGRDDSFNWELVGNALNGGTNISPDKLETAIKNNGTWGPGHYNPFNHNCHDFVQFCLDRIGCHESMIRKTLPCFRNQTTRRVVQIRSALDENKNLDIRGNVLKNGTDIVLYWAHNGDSQTFFQESYSDGTFSIIKDGYAIDVQYSEIKNGTPIQIWECNGTKAQKFITKQETGNYVSIHSVLDTNYVIDVCGAKTENFTKIQLYQYNGTDAQKFKFIYDNMEAFA